MIASTSAASRSCQSRSARCRAGQRRRRSGRGPPGRRGACGGSPAAPIEHGLAARRLSGAEVRRPGVGPDVGERVRVLGRPAARRQRRGAARATCSSHRGELLAGRAAAGLRILRGDPRCVGLERAARARAASPAAPRRRSRRGGRPPGRARVEPLIASSHVAGRGLGLVGAGAAGRAERRVERVLGERRPAAGPQRLGTLDALAEVVVGPLAVAQRVCAGGPPRGRPPPAAHRSSTSRRSSARTRRRASPLRDRSCAAACARGQGVALRRGGARRSSRRPGGSRRLARRRPRSRRPRGVAADGDADPAGRPASATPTPEADASTGMPTAVACGTPGRRSGCQRRPRGSDRTGPMERRVRFRRALPGGSAGWCEHRAGQPSACTRARRRRRRCRGSATRPARRRRPQAWRRRAPGSSSGRSSPARSRRGADPVRTACTSAAPAAAPSTRPRARKAISGWLTDPPCGDRWAGRRHGASVAAPSASVNSTRTHPGPAAGRPIGRPGRALDERRRVARHGSPRYAARVPAW